MRTDFEYAPGGFGGSLTLDFDNFGSSENFHVSVAVVRRAEGLMRSGLAGLVRRGDVETGWWYFGRLVHFLGGLVLHRGGSGSSCSFA